MPKRGQPALSLFADYSTNNITITYAAPPAVSTMVACTTIVEFNQSFCFNYGNLNASVSTPAYQVRRWSDGCRSRYEGAELCLRGKGSR